MAGRPKHRALMAEMESRGGEEWFFGEIVNGRSVLALAEEVGVSSAMVYDWINQERMGGGPERKELLKEARKLSAHTLADKAERAGEEATPITVGVQKLKADMLWRKAERYNREELGPQAPGGNVTINLDSLYLQALQAPRPEKALPVQPETPLLEAGPDAA